MSEHCYRAPEDDAKENQVLPVPFNFEYEPPWLIGRTVYIRSQAWNIIVSELMKIDKKRFSLFEEESWNSDGILIPYNEAKLHKLIKFLDEAIENITNLDTELYLKYQEFEYRYSNLGYVRMLESIQTVFRESLRLQKPYQAWGE